MYDVVENVSHWLPVRIFDTGGNPVAGVVFGSITAAVMKADHTQAAFTVLTTDWVEATSSAFSATGTYMIQVPASVLDQVGPLEYAVASGGSNRVHIGSVKVVRHDEGLPYVAFTSNGNTVAPIITQVASTKRTQVQVTYSEPVVMTTGSNGALNLSNYSVTGLTLITVVSLSSQQVLISTSTQTPNFLYDLTVVNVEDLNGNPIA